MNGRVAARGGEWAQHFSNASCCIRSAASLDSTTVVDWPPTVVVSGCENLTTCSEGRGPDAVCGGCLESVELLGEERRREIAARLTSAGCEMALSLVYSDGSTQLRETAADAKVE